MKVPPGILRTLSNHWKMRWFYLAKLPTLWWFGVRIREVTPAQASVELPFGWRTQNPFRSIYFAAQCAAAELSAGSLALVAMSDRGDISLLITGIDIQFHKKATSRTVFRCSEGQKIRDAVELAIATGTGQMVTIETRGTQATGELVSTARITFSFLARRAG